MVLMKNMDLKYNFKWKYMFCSWKISINQVVKVKKNPKSTKQSSSAKQNQYKAILKSMRPSQTIKNCCLSSIQKNLYY